MSTSLDEQTLPTMFPRTNKSARISSAKSTDILDPFWADRLLSMLVMNSNKKLKKQVTVLGRFSAIQDALQRRTK